MDSIYRINCFHTLLYELLLFLFGILCFILYLNNSGLPLSPQQPQEENLLLDKTYY